MIDHPLPDPMIILDHHVVDPDAGLEPADEPVQPLLVPQLHLRDRRLDQLHHHDPGFQCLSLQTFK